MNLETAAQSIAAPALLVLLDWSVRWAIVIAPLVVWFRVKPPVDGRVRHLLLTSAFLAGLIVPFMPRWILAGTFASGSAATAVIAEQPSGLVMPEFPAAVASATGDRAEPPGTTDRRPGADEAHVSVAPDPEPTPRRVAIWPVVVLLVGLAWAVVVLVLTVRLFAGHLQLRRLRSQACLLEGGSPELLNECRSRLGVRRGVTLATHPSVVTPIVIGGPRAMILVPGDWDHWPVGDRRDALLHELSHLAQRDDWAKWCEELIRIPLFFHPLVAWLLARLEQERELRCDLAVIAQGTRPEQYGRLLLAMAQRPGRLRPILGCVRSSPVILPFLRNVTLTARMEQLMTERKPMSQKPRQFRFPTRVTLGVLALAQAIVVGGVRTQAADDEPPTIDSLSVKMVSIAPATSAPAPAKPPASPELVAAIRAETEAMNARLKSLKDWTVRGIVCDPDGKPVADAEVVYYSFDRTCEPRNVWTDRDGTFAASVPGQTTAVGLVAYRKGFAPSSAGYADRTAVPSGPLEFALRKTVPFSGALVDARQQPLKHATVRIEAMATERADRSSSSEGYPDLSQTQTRVRLALETTTDESGRYTFPETPSRNGLKLIVSDSSAKRQWRVLQQSLDDDLTRTSMGMVTRERGDSPVITVKASRVFGTVKTSIPGLETAGLTIWSTGTDGRGMSFHRNTFKITETDAKGDFQFDGIWPGEIAIGAGDSEPDPRWTCRCQVVNLGIDESAQVTLELIRGVLLEGILLEQKSRMPIPNAVVQVYSTARVVPGVQPSVVRTDERGAYQLRVPPGHTICIPVPSPARFRWPDNQFSFQDAGFMIPEGVERFQAPAVELIRIDEPAAKP
jgi:beta-lactamase regulating signal transducer with metallopeptidase domain